MRRAGFVALGIVAAAAVAAAIGWAADGRGHDGRVGRNVTLAGRPIGGLRAEQLPALVDGLAQRWPGMKLRVTGGDQSFTTTMADAGVAFDAGRTTAAALAVGRDGPLPARVWSWTTSFVRHRTAAVHIHLDKAALRRTVAELDRGRVAAVEPSIKAKRRGFDVVPGRAGKGIDAEAVAEALPDAVANGTSVTVEVERGRVPPRFTTDDARALASRAVTLTAKPLRVRAVGTTVTVPTATLREWLTTRPGDTELELAVDTSRAVAGLAKLLPSVGRPATDAGFTVTGSGVSITPARDGTKCCADSAAEAVLAALEHRPSSPIELALRPRLPLRTEAEARALGIHEQVSTFTTRHKCCEARVKNIHRIADILRGHVIPPGATFSINQAVGKRTSAKGFVSAPVIENGQHSEDVGGGISQFATTTFNAAFFAGLEFGEYQSHSLYISRYPYGREATMGYPHPDLQIKNATPYGIVIWPTYTGTSLTVSFYSTRYYSSVVQSGQTKGPRGTCTVVTTERTRTMPGGKKSVDAVRATYRADEGLNCDGTRAPPPTSPGA